MIKGGALSAGRAAEDSNVVLICSETASVNLQSAAGRDVSSPPFM